MKKLVVFGGLSVPVLAGRTKTRNQKQARAGAGSDGDYVSGTRRPT